MSLYSEILAAGAPQGLPALTGETLQRILAGEEVNGYALGRGNYVGPQPTESSDLTGNAANFEQVIYRQDPRTTGTTARWHAWNPDGTYRGYGSGPGSTIDSLVMAATGAMLGGAAAGWGSGASGGMAAADAAAMDAAMIDMGAGATNVASGAELSTLGMGTAEQAAFLEANAGVLAPGGEVATGYGTTWGAGADGVIGSGATMSADGVALDQIANNYGSQELLDPTNYSNEGGNYPTTESTQGPGGAPVNSTQFPSSPMTDVNGNPITPTPNGDPQVVPPVNQTPGGNQVVPPPTPTNGINDFKALFDLLSGLYGLKLAGDAAEKSDPFGSQRPYYADRLRELEANPALIQGRPGYAAGRDAVNRSMASRGYLGSGNQAGALMRYSGDFYNQEANRLAGLAGAQIAPGNAYFNSADLAGRSLSNIGYGLMPYTVGGPR